MTTQEIPHLLATARKRSVFFLNVVVSAFHKTPFRNTRTAVDGMKSFTSQ